MRSPPIFFFSSRRRHTRLQGDWSSDVCSSDLPWASAAPRRSRWSSGPAPSSAIHRSAKRGSSPCWGSTASMLESLIAWLLDRFRDLGYPGIVVLMAIESSVLPLPSELVMPPAGYLAAKGEMSFWVAIACGVLGSILGALANYGLANWLGRPFIRRLGRYLWISDKSLARSERFFTDHGEISTFLARMLPVVRHLISLPAGLARMNLGKFVTFTGLGALVWCTILTWIGWFIGRKEDVIITVLNEEARSYAGRAVLILLPVLALVAAAYVWWRRRRVAQRGSAGGGGGGGGGGWARGVGGGGGRGGGGGLIHARGAVRRSRPGAGCGVQMVRLEGGRPARVARQGPKPA